MTSTYPLLYGLDGADKWVRSSFALADRVGFLAREITGRPVEGCAELVLFKRVAEIFVYEREPAQHWCAFRLCRCYWDGEVATLAWTNIFDTLAAAQPQTYPVKKFAFVDLTERYPSLDQELKP